VFCDPTSFSPSRRLKVRPIAQQIDEGIRQVRQRHAVERFLAYFQPGTNTYAPVDRLRTLYREALEQSAVIGLIVGTRPDCLSAEALELLAELSREKWVSIELGLQSIHDRSLDWMNRGHHYQAFVDAVGKVRSYGIPHVGAHVILGLPGEDRDDILATAREVARLGLDSIKLHNLYVVRNTPLAQMVDQGQVRLLQRDEYVGLVVDFLEQLPPYCVVDRLSGDAPPRYLVGPMWCLDKQGLRKAVDDELLARDSWQGRFHRRSEAV
jgi:radical SAM protein (TIGR01212 family)